MEPGVRGILEFHVKWWEGTCLIFFWSIFGPEVMRVEVWAATPPLLDNVGNKSSDSCMYMQLKTPQMNTFWMCGFPYSTSISLPFCISIHHLDDWL